MSLVSYSIIIEITDSPNVFGGFSPDLPGFSLYYEGDIPGAIQHAIDSLKEFIKYQKEIGEPIPAPNPRAQIICKPTIEIENPQLVSSSEVKRQLNISQSTLSRYVKKRLLPAYRFGRDLRFDPVDVSRFKARARIGGEATAD